MKLMPAVVPLMAWGWVDNLIIHRDQQIKLITLKEIWISEMKY